jgi:hypothetical protein
MRKRLVAVSVGEDASLRHAEVTSQGGKRSTRSTGRPEEDTRQPRTGRDGPVRVSWGRWEPSEGDSL